MDFVNVLKKSEPHQRTIIHLDMDCFYAQVEEIRNPSLCTRPLGIQQKNIVVTCNYVARAQGISKLMLITEAKRLCPDLVLVNGEDLSPYRLMSQKIFELLLNYTPSVEKLGFDENFMDVSSLVDIRQNHLESATNGVQENTMFSIMGHIYPADGTHLTACHCGCAQRLKIGTEIANEIREELRLRLGVTCCAGVSYNKLLAKLVGGQNKPNQQTVLVSTYAEQFMRELSCLQRITGIGQKTQTLLLESGVTNIEELQLCDMEFLRKKFGFETATKLKDLAFGRDTNDVRLSGKPKSIGMEDSCRPISVRTDVEEKFRMLLIRLLEQVAEDGRIPIAIKVVLRKFDIQKKSSHRESKQANIQPSLFKATNSMSGANSAGAKVQLVGGAQEKILKIVMRLFERIVDMNKPFNITLLGLAFTKFQERKIGSSSIANFLIKKTDLEVQSITSLTNTSISPTTAESPTTSRAANISCPEITFRSSPTTFKPSDQFYRRRATTASPIPMLLDNGSESGATNSDFSDFSETEVEPSPKKCRLGRLFLSAKRSRLAETDVEMSSVDVASPSKLRVCDLRLNSRDSEKEYPISPIATSPSTSASSTMTIMTTNQTRFRTIQPPNTLMNRIEGSSGRRFITSTRTRTASRLSSNASSTPSSPLPSPMDESCSTPSTPRATPTSSINEAEPGPEFVENNREVSPARSCSSSANRLSNVPCPSGVDPQVFKELPIDVQNELINSWRNSLAAAAAAAVAVANGNKESVTASSSSNSISSTQSAASTTAAAKNNTQKNTLYRYFLRNK